MGKLDELKQLVADAFKAAETKESIEQLATINNTIDDVQKEQDIIMNKNAELVKSYKDLVMHTSFKDTEHKPVDQVGGVMPSFEEALNSFMSKKKGD